MCQYLLPLEELDSDRLLSNWKRQLPGDATLVAVSCFGDLFLAASNGHILWLDTLEGQLHAVANSVDEWRRLLDDPAKIDQWFWPGFVESLQQRGESLAAAECYAWQVHPVIGGALESTNLKPMDVFAYHTVISQLHQLSEGFQPTGFIYEDDA